MSIKTPIILFLCCITFVACGGGTTAPEAATKKQSSSSSETPESVKFQAAVKHYRAIIPAVESADFVFYTDFGSASSGVQDLAQIRNFDKFITGRPATNPDECPFEGASVLYDKDGNILCEMDFVLKPGCEHVRLRMNNEYTMHGFTPQAVAYFNQFVEVINKMN